MAIQIWQEGNKDWKELILSQSKPQKIRPLMDLMHISKMHNLQ